MTSLAVVIPLFNKRAYVAETIASLAAQQSPPDHLIVIDDASTDDSAEVAAQALAGHAAAFAATRVELRRCPRNAGPGAARNIGIGRAATELILCLDADDTLRPDALHRVREAMSRHRLGMMMLGFESDPVGEAFPDMALLAGESLVPLEHGLFLLGDPLHIAAHPDFFMGRASNVAVRRSQLGNHRYCTDARLNEGVDLWYRDGETFLELRGRDSRSFQLAELTYDLDLFMPLVRGADAFQLRLYSDGPGHDRLELLVVDQEGACPTATIAADLAYLLRDAVPQDRLEVRCVSRDALHQDPATTKTPAIMDYRR